MYLVFICAKSLLFIKYAMTCSFKIRLEWFNTIYFNIAMFFCDFESNFVIMLLLWLTGFAMYQFMCARYIAEKYGNLHFMQWWVNLNWVLLVQILKMTLKSSIKTVRTYHQLHAYSLGNDSKITTSETMIILTNTLNYTRSRHVTSCRLYKLWGIDYTWL